MDKLDKVIRGLKCSVCPTMPCGNSTYFVRNENDPDTGWCDRDAIYKDALDLLKAEELPPVKPEKLEERTTKWLDNMTAEERLKEIAAILDDWDGYRTAKGLGGLINEIWAYALYPVKTQEPVKWVKISPAGIYECSGCGQNVMTSDIDAYKYCHGCGKKVKRE